LSSLFFFLPLPRLPRSTLFPYTTLFRSPKAARGGFTLVEMMVVIVIIGILAGLVIKQLSSRAEKAKVEATKAMIAQVSESLNLLDRKSTRLNSSHDQISYAVFCLKKKKT